MLDQVKKEFINKIENLIGILPGPTNHALYHYKDALGVYARGS
jgi:hypothetical protein